MDATLQQSLVRTLRERFGHHSNLYANDPTGRPAKAQVKVKRNLQRDPIDLHKVLSALFHDITGTELTIHVNEKTAFPKSHWLNPKSSWMTSEAYGLQTFLYTFGALPSDGVDHVFKLALPDGSQLTTWRGEDYSQGELTATVNSPTQALADTLTTQVTERFALYPR